MANKPASQVLDFTNVKERGQYNSSHVDPGDYTAKVVSVDDEPAKDGTPMWCFGIVADDVPRAVYPYYCKLQENQLWKVRALFGAVGVEVGKRKVRIDPNKLIGKSLGIALEDDEYEGRLKSVIAEVFPQSEVGGSNTAPDDDDEDLPEDELDEDIEEDEPEPPKKRASRRKKAPEPEPEEEDDEEEEEEDEEPEPPKRRRAAKKAAPARRKKAPVVEDDDDEDLEEIDIDEL